MQKNQIAIVFDLDGTLADTAPDLLASLNHAVRDHGFGQFTLSEVGALVGQGSLAMIRRAFSLHETPLEEELLMRLHHEFLDHYEANIAVGSRLYPGVETLLDRLSAAGHPLAVCTNKYESMACLLLDRLGVANRFAAVTGGDTFAFRKPDPRHLVETIAMAGAATGIMVGDTITDATAAKNAAKPLILVDFGYSAEPVAAMGADAVLSHFDEAWDAIGTITREWPR
ncbi:MAG: HAD-IA family hydrolase [Nitratireductor sp.]|nr:HAD-IA family hydrolase [Nitratireductor sp.]